MNVRQKREAVETAKSHSDWKAWAFDRTSPGNSMAQRIADAKALLEWFGFADK